jgi:cytochrome c oxidase cbb3-type subunit 3
MSTPRDFDVADAALPRWWVVGLALTVGFGTCYWLYYEAFKVGPGPLDSYVAEKMKALDTGEEVTEAALTALAADPLAIKAGEQVFSRNCVECHGASGEGKIGPNLTDDYWIGGGAPLDIYQTILHGREARGMPNWRIKLGPGACKQAAAYVLGLRGKNLPGKPPQGQRWPK